VSDSPNASKKTGGTTNSEDAIGICRLVPEQHPLAISPYFPSLRIAQFEGFDEIKSWLETTSFDTKSKAPSCFSPSLRLLHEASWGYWKDEYIERDNSEDMRRNPHAYNYPENSEIEAFLTGNPGAVQYGKKLARFAAIIIRPLYAHGNVDMAAQKDRKHYLTQEFFVLAITAARFFSGSDAQNKRPTNKEIETFIRELDPLFTTYLIASAATIIRHDSDRKH
jgi:hypothetical protein